MRIVGVLTLACVASSSTLRGSRSLLSDVEVVPQDEADALAHAGELEEEEGRAQPEARRRAREGQDRPRLRADGRPSERRLGGPQVQPHEADALEAQRDDLEGVRRQVHALAASEELDKPAALTVLRLFHAMETVLRHECAARDRALHDALHAHLGGEAAYHMLSEQIGEGRHLRRGQTATPA